MKKLFTFLCFIALLGSSLAQEYFPSQTGFEWKFKVTPLDEQNNPQPTLAYFRIDSFTTNANYKGQDAKIVLTKEGSIQSIQQQLFSDSLFYHTEGSDGYEYFRASSFGSFVDSLDALGIDPNFNFKDFFNSLQNWYPVYKFASDVNSEYSLLSVDVTIDSNPIRLEYTGTRLADQILQTTLGNLSTKVFLKQLKVSTFLGTFQIPLFSIKDSIWIAPNNWIVQDIVPTTIIDITLLGVNTTILGRQIKLTDEIVSDVKNDKVIPVSARLEQNYPNPFNPSTKISYTVPGRSNVSLKVFNLLGTEVAELVNGEMEADTYNINFDALNLPSGVYFYRLQAGSFVQTRKMILLK